MNAFPVVIDTNVILSGLRFRNGFSFTLLKQIPEKLFTMCISVPLILEYETVLTKHMKQTGLTKEDIGDFIDYTCCVGRRTEIFYLWRPVLKDPFDDHVLELAVASGSRYIISFNKKDFSPARSFGIGVVSPKEFLQSKEEIE
ncbi:PilT protein domain protein [Sediminispirochaeta smaragdinae DSM 11293]|uniref:PilT protein domain protein n=2 Tax=Sediminispirochaeta TaxID=1911556 RepID=E1R8K4_SEDSS|nr:PilT protein domain protein [Sediminispirochaeta smaragdinae DSM 11293]